MFACANFVQLAVVAVFRPVGNGLVVTLALFHQRHDLAQCLERKIAEFVEANIQQCVDHFFGIGQVQFAQLGFHFGIVLVHAQHPSDVIE